METVNIENLLIGRFNTPNLEGAITIISKKLLTESNSYRFPVSLNNLTKFLNIKTISNNFLDNDALLFIKNENYIIEFNNSKNWRRQRFTIAHEIFHVVLFDLFSDTLDFNKVDLKKIEYICDLGASEILVPNSEFKKDIFDKKITLDLIEKLVEKYMVSYTVIFRKINQLFPEISIYIWKKYARKIEEKNEYRVFKAFQKYTKTYKYPYLPIGCSTRHLSCPEIFDKNQIKNGEIEIDINKGNRYEFYIEKIEKKLDENQ
ncbi:ImmA/IrrE family metallo-endopeptidase, partial [Flavobacterium sp.]